MLSSGMMESEQKRIEFPDKNPSHWEVLLRCIDPTIALFASYGEIEDGGEYCDSGEDDAPLNGPNARALVPLFHELQMDFYLRKCDVILCDSAGDKLCNTAASGHGAPKRNIQLLRFSTKYGLQKTKEYVEKFIGQELEQFFWACGDYNPDNFDMSTVEELVELFRPMKVTEEVHQAKKQRIEGTTKSFYESSNFNNLWAQVSSCITDDDLSQLPIEEVNEGTVLSRIIYYAMQRYHKTMKSDLQQIYHQLEGFSGKCHLFVDNASYNQSCWISRQNSRCLDAKVFISASGLIVSAVRDLVPYEAGLGNFMRKYQLDNSDDEKVLRMTSEPNLSEENSSSVKYKYRRLPDEIISAEPYKLRYIDTDLTVVVGSGEHSREYDCHRTLLSLASSTLDIMVSASCGRLILPDLDPQDWELFYLSIDPRYNGHNLNEDIENVKRLFPFFKKFQMEKCFELSKSMLSFEIDCLEDGLNYDRRLQDIIDLLKFAVQHNAQDLQQRLENMVASLFDSDDRDVIVYYELDAKAAKDLVSLCLPINRSSEQESFSSARCPMVWNAIHGYRGVQKKLKSVTFNSVSETEAGVFSNLMFILLQNEAKKRRRASMW